DAAAFNKLLMDQVALSVYYVLHDPFASIHRAGHLRQVLVAIQREDAAILGDSGLLEDRGAVVYIHIHPNFAHTLDSLVDFGRLAVDEDLLLLHNRRAANVTGTTFEGAAFRLRAHDLLLGVLLLKLLKIGPIV